MPTRADSPGDQHRRNHRRTSTGEITVSDGLDLNHFVQHRQLDVYEQSMARQGYAYGVDLRRSRWLASSTVGNALVRAVDRAWAELSAELSREVLLDCRAIPGRLLGELAVHMHVLRAPLPTVRPLRADQRGRWPLVTALGATRGAAQWLLLDVEGLMALSLEQRAFLLGAGLGHLHCEHAVYFSAHLLAARSPALGFRTLRSVLDPWTKVMMFSADRAGLISCGRLDVAIAMIETPPVAVGDDPDPAWLPSAPVPAVRVRALEEFARSSVFARITAVRARQREYAAQLRSPALRSDSGQAEPSANGEREAEPIHVPADAWSLARVDARLTARLNLI
jgi:hypothetical protein